MRRMGTDVPPVDDAAAMAIALAEARQAGAQGDIPVGATAHRWLEIPGIDRPPLAAVRAWRDRLAERPGFRAHVQLPLS